ncbi:hypothetical protein M2451_001141 [Dysgonomonas sp. PFB1-18]|uniref:DUF3329 domain-containing protein n=1 Tax=unclassified Dysgonomonas TaxID=2630389 RepID=UPI002476488F|nr:MULTISPECIES: DUF6056 family protein [unclassified Dysgonomonas]MDH6308234.1 hypothetical protein [Dysgonomonas sp. PF1-14]MDH6338327.1 hypothetical protein [Dysgonomonas sp. PF1-16]MDH6379824.1 hypothetical protein [Dysgonomonas sp. PFB1-18]MDH6397086.1 hypothetical protein [Dysgonomonas sp. PF1-23]
MADVEKTDIFDKVLVLVHKLYNKVNTMFGEDGNFRRRPVLWSFLVLSCFLVLLLLNILTPFVSDDYVYLYVYGETQPVESLGDIIQSQVNHYFLWGGRSVVHFVAQVLLILPSYMSDILNASVYMGYVFLIYYHIKGKGEGSISLFLIVNMAIWFFQPVFGDTILWVTGSANYLWGTFFILLLLLPFRLYDGSHLSPIKQLVASVGLFILGVIAGWSNENTSGGMILIIILFLLYYRSKAWKAPVWSYVGLLGSIIGFAIMILAPGNFERAGEAGSLSLFILGYRLFNCTLTFFYHAGPFILVSLIVTILYYHFPKEEDGDRKREKLKLSFIYSIAGVAAVYAMVLSPSFPRRALFGVVTYLVIGAGILLYNTDFKYRLLQQVRSTIIMVGSVCLLFTVYMATKEIKTYRNIVQERKSVIEQVKKEGGDSCEFERFHGGQYIHGEDPFAEESMSRYYGIRIKLK